MLTRRLCHLPLNSNKSLTQQIGPRCRFSQTARVASGHSKWATIKHDKAKADGAKNRQRSALAKEIALAAKLKGADPTSNTRLATALEKARKGSVPKALIEAALARGQGRSAGGATLEACTLEAIVPPSGVAVVIECETDNRLRTLAELRTAVKDHGGSVTPTSYMFEKRGEIVINGEGKNITEDEVLEAALEAGALDAYDSGNGRHVVLTEPAQTSAVAEMLAACLGTEIESSEIVWTPKEDTKVDLSSDEGAKSLMDFFAAVQEVSEVQAIFMNAARGAVSEDAWHELQERVSV